MNLFERFVSTLTEEELYDMCVACTNETMGRLHNRIQRGDYPEPSTSELASWKEDTVESRYAAIKNYITRLRSVGITVGSLESTSVLSYHCEQSETASNEQTTE